MASYFELPSREHASAAANIEQLPKEERKQLGRMSLMSPAITQLLDDLGDEDSSSSSEGGSLSRQHDLADIDHIKKDPSSHTRQDKQKQSTGRVHRSSSPSPSRKSPKSSPSRASAQPKASSVSAPRSGGSSVKQKPAHMARFHSLRSMLFQANIEDRMKTGTQADCGKEETAANKWKSQHEQRQIHRPKTPEKDTTGKDGIGGRFKTRIRRMTSREVPTMGNIRENETVVEFDDRGSTASSDNELDQHSSWKGDGDDESIHHSDVDELFRWVSRRDPASDGEARKGAVVHHEIVAQDSGHESLGHSDVDDLVRWVSRRSDTQEPQKQHTGYSDASTESDSENLEKSSDEEEDPEELVRWISHRDGPKAGPVRHTLERPELDSEVEKHYDSDVPELGRWFKRHDGTSGESAVSSPVRERADMFEEEERGRPRSRESISPLPKQKNHLTDDDVDDLVRWVSRRDSKQLQPSVLENDDQTFEWKRQEDAKKQQLGMTKDQGSLSHGDIQELVAHVRTNSQELPTTSLPNKSESTIVQDIKHDENDKKQQLGMTVDEGSLSHSDVQGLIAHVRGDSGKKTASGSALRHVSAGDTNSFSSGQLNPLSSKNIENTKHSQQSTEEFRRGSLGNEDVDELVRWVSRKNM